MILPPYLFWPLFCLTLRLGLKIAMKRYLISFLFFLFCGLALVAQPKKTLVFDNNTQSLGTIFVSETAYTKAYPFKNAGLLPLQIQVVSTPCVCAEVSWPKEEIAPGETGEIIVTFHANAANENLSLTFYVYSNGIPNPNAIFLKAKVKEPRNNK